MATTLGRFESGSPGFRQSTARPQSPAIISGRKVASESTRADIATR